MVRCWTSAKSGWLLGASATTHPSINGIKATQHREHSLVLTSGNLHFKLQKISNGDLFLAFVYFLQQVDAGRSRVCPWNLIWKLSHTWNSQTSVPGDARPYRRINMFFVQKWGTPTQYHGWSSFSLFPIHPKIAIAVVLILPVLGKTQQQI